ncbi:mannitol-1-phosphate 5-dehydrogenase [Curtobacterium sp. MCBD17_040]|uniref:mannitol-1-phosphate 5-dehydrogenase n=1 Tax=Curtobacterium sp. MCBD17_040 TaxID=2175674 RepID=UPI000DA75A1D|nr:mannitol-1-phosphate 5-dehydrogenase [Curtobacterium sp. MCBD17_040]WIB62495.1 mannitol-1-phosphate 5-dehydrogenase [Curtobacterium sp. MCBD17_040]
MAVTRRAVHIGAGKIGRGFVGQFLAASGYDLTFVDVDDRVVRALNESGRFVVHEVGDDPIDRVVEGFAALNSKRERDRVVEAIAGADVVTTAVGARTLPLVAPFIAEGLAARPAGAGVVTVVACENAINATDSLHASVWRSPALEDHDIDAVFANCAIDRIVPEQTGVLGQSGGLDVVLEPFYEWVIERTPFSGVDAEPPAIQGVTWVDDLQPFVERKLYTVNTAHATAAYHGFVRGIRLIREALEDDLVRAEVDGVLDETTALLVAKHGFDPEEHRRYVQANLVRIANPLLPDTTARVGRNPLRKLGRRERFIGPAAQLAERGMPVDHLLGAVRVALEFDDPDDPESFELHALLRSGATAHALTEILTGLMESHPLFPAVRSVVASTLES